MTTLANLSKAKTLLTKFQSEQLQSQNYLQIKINLKGLKYIQNPTNGQKYAWTQILKMKIQDKFNQKLNLSQSIGSQQQFLKLYVRNNITMAQIYRLIRNKMNMKFREGNFENQSLQLYCKGRLISGNQNLMTIKEVVAKYETNVFTCEKMEVFG